MSKLKKEVYKNYQFHSLKIYSKLYFTPGTLIEYTVWKEREGDKVLNFFF